MQLMLVDHYGCSMFESHSYYKWTVVKYLYVQKKQDKDELWKWEDIIIK